MHDVCGEGASSIMNSGFVWVPVLSSLLVGRMHTTVHAAQQGRHTGLIWKATTWATAAGSTDQGCCMIWGMPIRWAGLATRMRSSRSLHSSDALICGGKLYSTFRMRYTTVHSNAGCLASRLSACSRQSCPQGLGQKGRAKQRSRSTGMCRKGRARYNR